MEFVSAAAPAGYLVPDQLAASCFCVGLANFGKNLVSLRVAELNNKTESFWQSLPFN